MLRLDLRDYSDAYVVVKGTINVTDPNNNAYDKKLAFIKNTPFSNLILKINNTLIDNAIYINDQVYEIITEMNQIVEQKEL